MKAVKPAAMTTGSEADAVKSPNGPATAARTPILRERSSGEERGEPETPEDEDAGVEAGGLHLKFRDAPLRQGTPASHGRTY